MSSTRKRSVCARPARRDVSDPRSPAALVHSVESHSPASARAFVAEVPQSLTQGRQSGGLHDNVRELLDWLIDEELKRWQRQQ